MLKFTRPHAWGVLFIFVGVLLLLDPLFEIHIDLEEFFFPLLFIGTGVSFFLPKE